RAPPHALHAPRGRGRLLHGPRGRSDLLRRRQDLLAPAADRGRGDRPRQELLLHRFDHGSTPPRPGPPPDRGEPRSDALPRGGSSRLAGALLHATATALE